MVVSIGPERRDLWRRYGHFVYGGSTGQTCGMQSKGAGEVLKAMVARFNTGDEAEVEAIVHPDYVDHQGLGDGPVTGTAGFTTVVTVARSGFYALEVVVEDLIEQADRAAARLRWHGTPKLGKPFQRETIEIIRVQDGLAIEHWGGHS